jgi:hypothetical protein
MRTGNLRVARPIEPDPQTYQQFLQVVGATFQIADMASIEPPQWKMSDLFGV